MSAAELLVAWAVLVLVASAVALAVIVYWDGS